MGAESPTRAELPSLRARRPEPKGEVRRAALLAALESLLRERSLPEVGVGEIAARAGLTRSAFYFYFASKEAAVTELLHDVFTEMVGGAQAWLSGEGDPRESLRAALAGTLGRWRAHRHLIVAMLDARDDPAVRGLWDSWVDGFVAPLAAGVEAERARGRAPADGPPAEVMVGLLLGMNERALERHARRDTDERQDAELLDALTSAWLAVIYGGRL